MTKKTLLSVLNLLHKKMKVGSGTGPETGSGPPPQAPINIHLTSNKLHS